MSEREPSGNGIFPPDHEPYAWQQTAVEATLREAMERAMDSSQHPPHCTLSSQYDGYDVLTSHIRQTGTTATLMAKRQYAASPFDSDSLIEPVAPLELGVTVGMVRNKPDAHAHIIVPSRYFTEHRGQTAYARQPEECQPPHARVTVREGVVLPDLFETIGFNLSFREGSDVAYMTGLANETTAVRTLFTLLRAHEASTRPPDGFGLCQVTFPLSEPQMAGTQRWVLSRFGPPTG